MSLHVIWWSLGSWVVRVSILEQNGLDTICLASVYIRTFDVIDLSDTSRSGFIYTYIIRYILLYMLWDRICMVCVFVCMFVCLFVAIGDSTSYVLRGQPVDQCIIERTWTNMCCFWFCAPNIYSLELNWIHLNSVELTWAHLNSLTNYLNSHEPTWTHLKFKPVT